MKEIIVVYQQINHHHCVFLEKPRELIDGTIDGTNEYWINNNAHCEMCASIIARTLAQFIGVKYEKR